MTHQLHIKTSDGTPVLLRPLELRDEAALAEAIGSFSNRSRYMRFFSGVQPVPAPVIHRLADVDGACHLAWVAIDESKPERPVIGATHAMRGTADEPVADFAIGLVDAWQHKGVARLLVALLAAESRGKGIASMTAEVLWENRKGRALMTTIGANSTGTDGDVIHFRFDTETALKRLNEAIRGDAQETVFTVIESGGLVPAAA
ncbi:GNAT family N-acetyltransferase [Henriciella aquimarina]|uniref:GNAT family N-acetyltransferase n=1 Tax=Henriciella aquimarina TaxID=545261 RepID=UPI0009FE4EEA|nr:hypothetical protein [Henriciella aquimarina]